VENEASPVQDFWTQAADSLQQLREWLFARRVCGEALAAYKAVRRRQPGLADDALYQAVIIQRTGLDAEAARHLLELALASREDWETERRARFRDVVMYMIVTEYLARSRGVQGMSIDLCSYLDRRVPHDY
jgi:hypothetical protein